MVGTVKKSMAATSPILQICRTCEVEARSGAVSSTVEPWSLPVLDGQIRMRDQPLRRQVREAILPVGMAPRQGTPVDFVCCCYCSLLLQNGTTAVVFAYFGPLLVLLIRRSQVRILPGTPLILLGLERISVGLFCQPYTPHLTSLCCCYLHFLLKNTPPLPLLGLVVAPSVDLQSAGKLNPWNCRRTVFFKPSPERCSRHSAESPPLHSLLSDQNPRQCLQGNCALSNTGRQV